MLWMKPEVCDRPLRWCYSASALGCCTTTATRRAQDSAEKGWGRWSTRTRFCFASHWFSATVFSAPCPRWLSVWAIFYRVFLSPDQKECHCISTSLFYSPQLTPMASASQKPLHVKQSKLAQETSQPVIAGSQQSSHVLIFIHQMPRTA